MPVIKKQAANGQPAPAKTGSVIDRISRVEFDKSRGLKIMLYGQSGTGKTTLWGSFPGPLLCAVCSGGISAGELLSLSPDVKKKTDAVTLSTSFELMDLVKYQRETRKYKTFVLDHVTGLQDLTITEILGFSEIPTQKSWGMATQQQWGQSNMQCKDLLRPMLDLVDTGTNIIIIGQERTTEPKEDSVIGVPSIGVAATGGLAGWLNPAVDYICQTFKRPVYKEVQTNVNGKISVQTIRDPDKPPEYCLRVGPHDLYTTKFRKPKENKLPDVLTNPSYNGLYALIKKVQGIQ